MLIESAELEKPEFRWFEAQITCRLHFTIASRRATLQRKALIMASNSLILGLNGGFRIAYACSTGV